MKTLCKPENDAEAIAIRNLLADNGIQCVVQSFHDTAYDGLYQAQYGWGVIKVNEEDLAAARDLVEQWKENAPDLDENDFWSETDGPGQGDEE